MKSSKSNNSTQSKNNGERKSSKPEKASKLDRKSSRGMIFENEELRLRTININAEVERGQTDIKRLRKENEQLRREIWTLRDECDRLNKRFKAKILDQENGGCNVRGSGSSGCNRCPSQSNSDDSDSCDTCKGDDNQCSDDCCQFSTAKQNDSSNSKNSSRNSKYPKLGEPQNLHNATTFDHLSVVSEETLCNSSELQYNAQQQQGNDRRNPQFQLASNAAAYTTTNTNGSKTTLMPNLTDGLTPLTPIELVANQWNDLQSNVPPLSYFENILQDHMGSNIGASPDSSSVSPNGKIMKHTNGWDYNLQSPFAQRKQSNTSSTTSPSTSSVSMRSPTVKRCPPTQQTLTTFISTPSTPPPTNNLKADIGRSIGNNGAVSSPPKIETVAITTMPTTAPPPPPSSFGGSPKFLCSPLKSRLKMNTSLANKNAVIPTPPIVPTTHKIDSCQSDTTLTTHQNCDPPDIFVANALASPYKRPLLSSQSQQSPQNNTFSNDNHIESANLEAILNDIENLSEDILAIQLEKNKSRENLNLGNTCQNSKPLHGDAKNKKPYRSEMNLMLSFDGSSPTIIRTQNKSCTNQFTSSDNILRTRARSLERESTDSPSPKIPDAMPAFPNNHSYMDLEKAKKGLTATALQLIKQQGSKSATSSPKKLPPPTPPTRFYLPSSLHSRYADFAKSDPVVNGVKSPPPVHGLVPNKSHLYQALANAAAKRGRFLQASPLSRSLDNELDTPSDGKNVAGPNENTTQNSPDTEEASKTRRVSIVGDGSPNTPDKDLRTTVTPIPSAYPIPLTPANPQLSTGSCTNLNSTPTNPLLQSLKQVTCHSTPNSPHSARRNNDPPSSQDDLVRSSRTHYHHQLSNISNTGSHHRCSSQDFSPNIPQETNNASVNQTAIRSKCSRRHSDATLTSKMHRISGINGHSHHHHHHHHQHSTSMLKNGHQQNNRQSNQDNNLETGSVSDQNSNSFASSRDSSTSFSTRSQRRKISVSSHTGGKIPWCGCWGNGCL